MNSEDAGDTLLVNCWIPLVDARAGNGCMQMMRGTHGQPLLPHDLRVPVPGGKHCVGIDDRDLPRLRGRDGRTECGRCSVDDRTYPKPSAGASTPDTALWDCRPVVLTCLALSPPAAIILTAWRGRPAIGTRG